MKTGLLQFKALEIAEAWRKEGIGAAAGLLSVPRNGPAGAYLAAMVLAHMIRVEAQVYERQAGTVSLASMPEWREYAAVCRSMAERCVDLAQAIGDVAPGSDNHEE